MLYAAAAVLTVLVLLLDARTSGRWQQHALGALLLAMFLVALRFNTRAERREAWLCVGVSTAIELFMTQIWGLYTYRLGNLPLYVPPGHGLIYAVAASTSRGAFMQARGRWVVGGVLAVATGWAVVGLVVPPLLDGPLRADVHGVLYWPFFAWYAVSSRHARPFALTFGLVAVIELVGVRVGNWHWAAVMPGLWIPSADPPSVVAGGYCFFGLLAHQLAHAQGWKSSRMRLPSSTEIRNAR